MKKKKWLMVVSLLIAVVIAISLVTFTGKRPYKDLKTSDIVSATVLLGPPDKTVEIVEIKEFVALLKDVVIYNADDSYMDYAGQTVTFTLEMADGTTEKITVCNPFIIINGTGYKTKYEPCERLAYYANELLSRYE
ncbi:hypothetical protein [Fusicatenibacter sp.]